MSYYGVQNQYATHPKYRHRDGTVHGERDFSLVGQLIIGWHDTCATEAFGIDTSGEGWGSWHHGDTGISWGPWRAGVPCESCGEVC